MHDHDLGHGWHLSVDEDTALLCGPGELEIVLRLGAMPSPITHCEGLGQALIGTLRQLRWIIPIARPTPGDATHLDLELLVTWDSANPEAPMQYVLHLGTGISWHLHTETGQRLEAWCARQEA